MSVKAAFILISVASSDGGLYMSLRGSMATSWIKPRFQAKDFQNIFPVVVLLASVWV